MEINSPLRSYWFTEKKKKKKKTTSFHLHGLRATLVDSLKLVPYEGAFLFDESISSCPITPWNCHGFDILLFQLPFLSRYLLISFLSFWAPGSLGISNFWKYTHLLFRLSFSPFSLPSSLSFVLLSFLFFSFRERVSISQGIPHARQAPFPWNISHCPLTAF